ncbi:hypothetical protein FWF74_03640 [Candidatus Saccharibacteria bacterium]|nr:hypothetical protein [Candidatus Saccharibacteria bacterium]MCL1962867.1 hypothetical protein [Candidatus Saccharibacteria bacterium]
MPFKIGNIFTSAASIFGDKDILLDCLDSAMMLYTNDHSEITDEHREKYKLDVVSKLLRSTRTECEDGSIIERRADTKEALRRFYDSARLSTEVSNETYLAAITEGQFDDLSQDQLVDLHFLLERLRSLNVAIRGARLASDMYFLSKKAGRLASNWMKSELGQGIFSGVASIEQAAVDDLIARTTYMCRVEDDELLKGLFAVFSVDGDDLLGDTITDFTAASAHVRSLMTPETIETEEVDSIAGEMYQDFLDKLPFRVGEPFIDASEALDLRESVGRRLYGSVMSVHQGKMIDLDDEERDFRRHSGAASRIIEGVSLLERYPHPPLTGGEEKVRYDNFDDILTGIVREATTQDDPDAFLESQGKTIHDFAVVYSTVEAAMTASAIAAASTKGARYAKNWLESVKGRGVFSGIAEQHAASIEDLRKKAGNALKDEKNPDARMILETVITDLDAFSSDLAGFCKVSREISKLLDEKHAAEAAERETANPIPVNPVADPIPTEPELIEIPTEPGDLVPNPPPASDESTENPPVMEVEESGETADDREVLIPEGFEEIEIARHYSERGATEVETTALLARLASEATGVILPEGARSEPDSEKPVTIKRPRTANDVILDDREEWLAKRKTTANLAWNKGWQTLADLAALIVDESDGRLYKSRLGDESHPIQSFRGQDKRKQQRKHPYYAFEFPAGFDGEYTAVIAECAEPNNATYIWVGKTALKETWQSLFELSKREAKEGGVRAINHRNDKVPHWERAMNEVDRQVEELDRAILEEE